MVIISGASRGIGNFLLKYFLTKKVDVIGFYNKTKPIENVDHFWNVNITSEDNILNFIDKNKSRLENIVLLNCAGNNYNSFAHKSDPLSWEEVIKVNLFGTYLLTKSLLPIMREDSYGRIVNFSSIVAQKGIMGTSAYASSKSGLWGLTKSIAIENANKNITINSLNLGYFNIGMISEVPDKILETIVENIPMKKLGDPKNIINAIDFIVKSDYLTGTTIDINGGLF